MIFPGCAKLAHLDQLLTLKTIGDNKALQKQYVDKQNQNFEKLLKVVQENKIQEYPSQESIRRAFGDPLFIKDIERDDQRQIKWLYRYSAEPFGSEKVYLYFTADGRLIDSEYIEKPPPRDPADNLSVLTHETANPE